MSFIPTGGGGGGTSSSADSYLTAQGLKAWTFDPRLTGTSTTPTSQQLRATSIWLPAGLVVTNLVTCVGVIGNTMTGAFCGVYSGVASPVLLQGSANQTALFTAGTGYVACPLSSPLSIPTTGLYYLAFLGVGTAAPALLANAQGTASVAGGAPTGTGIIMAWAQAGVSTLPTPATPAINNTMIWFGIT